MTSPNSPKPRRAFLTKAEQQTAIGIELISLCQTITEDGRLLRDEFDQIKNWLDAHKDSDLPAIESLKMVVSAILADGIVTDEELHQLHLCLEKLLPVEVREIVKAAHRKADQEDRAKNAPVEEWDFMVAGCRYEGRGEVIEECVQAGDPARLVREPYNRYSSNAIAVCEKGGRMVGYVPECDARRMAGMLDSGHKYEAVFKKVLSGSETLIPVVIAALFAPDSVNGTICEGSKSKGGEPSAWRLGRKSSDDDDDKPRSREGNGALGCLWIFIGFVLTIVLVKSCIEKATQVPDYYFEPTPTAIVLSPWPTNTPVMSVKKRSSIPAPTAKPTARPVRK